MALRLANAAQITASAVRADRVLADQARAALASGDLARLPALAAEAATLDDVHARYVIRRTLVELGLTAAGRARGGAAARTLVATARTGLEALAAAPAEPVLLNLTGVALYEVGALRGAEALFAAAQRLDAGLADAAGNLREVARRRRTGARTTVPPDVSLALPELSRRAAALAGAAVPAPPGTISLCMIVRDEEAVLDRCLASVRGHVDELVVVDTGSTDGTVAIARAHGARIVEFAWNDSFADARNAGLAVATGEWILFLDADEVLVAEDAPRLRELTRRSWREAFLLTITNFIGGRDSGTAVVHDTQRLFRNRPEHRFTGRIHESIAAALPADAPERVELGAVRVEHYGYLAQVRDAKGKSRRNLELLERQARDGDDTPFLHYNLGSEHAALGDHARAVDHFARALDRLDALGTTAQVPYGPSLLGRHVTALRVAGRVAEARAAAARGLELLPGFTDLVLEQALAARAEGELAEAAALLERCLELGDAPSAYAATVGAGSFLALTLLGSVRRALGDGPGARAVLLRCLAEHPRYTGAVAPAAEALLAEGATGEEVEALLAERLGPLAPGVRFALAATLYEAGHLTSAETQLRRVVDADPQAAPARLALAEALLSQGRWAEAADAAAAVPTASPTAAAAAVTEAFAAIVAGDEPGTGAALARAAAAGTPDAQRELLGAWALATRGEELPGRLPGAAAPLLLTVLEALLRVEEVERFVELLPALERLDGVDARTRRGALAGLYERRGLLESAADEWIASVQETGAHPAALLGLARIAAAQGATEDAEALAAEARALAGG